MTTSTSPPSRVAADRRARAWASGFSFFAGVVMTGLGLDQAFLGVAAIRNDDVYAPTPDYVYGLDLTAWGWLHLVCGLLLVLTGVSVLRGKAWARVVGMALAALSIVINFVFVPYYASWSLIIIGLDVAVIWGLARSTGDPY